MPVQSNKKKQEYISINSMSFCFFICQEPVNLLVFCCISSITRYDLTAVGVVKFHSGFLQSIESANIRSKSIKESVWTEKVDHVFIYLNESNRLI